MADIVKMYGLHSCGNNLLDGEDITVKVKMVRDDDEYTLHVNLKTKWSYPFSTEFVELFNKQFKGFLCFEGYCLKQDEEKKEIGCLSCGKWHKQNIDEHLKHIQGLEKHISDIHDEHYAQRNRWYRERDKLNERIELCEENCNW